MNITHQGLIKIAAPLALLLLSACSGQVDFAAAQNASANTPAGNAATDTDVLSPPPGGNEVDLVCTPDPTRNQSAVYGLNVEAYHSPSGGAQTSLEYISSGVKVNNVFRFEEVFIPTRNSSSGLVTRGGVAIKKENGELLTVNFALDFRSNFTLGPLDQPGYYQFAMLTDDGATFQLESSDGRMNTIVANEGVHSTSMGCSPEPMKMRRGAVIPMRMTYFQGPAHEIAVSLLWRKWPENDPQGRSGCVGGGNFFNSDKSDLSNEMKAMGWQLLKTSNFQLAGASEICRVN